MRCGFANAARFGLSARLPANGPAREILREKGQFWTPAWVAQAMVLYAASGGAEEIFDPAVGAGAFFCAAKNLQPLLGRELKLLGREIDENALFQAREAGLGESDLANVELRDFVLEPPARFLAAIIANPPYIRHHRLGADTKARLRAFARQETGLQIDGRAGYHVYFLIRALSLLAPNGRLAFIMPADICEGVFAPALWRWITAQFCLDSVVTFDSAATPFPGVDTNALVFFVRRAAPRSHFRWAKCLEADSPAFFDWVLNDLESAQQPCKIEVVSRAIAEGLSTGFSRPPQQKREGEAVLGDFARVMRGVATGANDFFCFSDQRKRESGIDEQFFVPIVARTRDIAGEIFDICDLQTLDVAGRPRWMLQLPAQNALNLPQNVQNYLKIGIEQGLPMRPLIAARKWWFCSERRAPPPFLFAYLGRRSARFIRNFAGVAPLTGFLCVYPRSDELEFIEKLWLVLRDERTIFNLFLVGKSYGGDAIKVEPRALERLAFSCEVLNEAGLNAIERPLAPLTLPFG